MTVVAHGIGQSADLPLPLDLVLQAGAATVVVSFLIAASMRHKPRAGDETERHVGPARWRWPVRLVVLALSLYLVGDAFLGPAGEDNPTPYALYVGLWVGLVPLSVLFGPVWRAVNPLRTLFELLRLPSGTRTPPTGVWPAVLGLLAFTWLELVAPHRADPVVVGCCLVAYGLLHLGLATVYGEEWFARADFFEVYSESAGRLSPLRRRHPLAVLSRTGGETAGPPQGESAGPLEIKTEDKTTATLAPAAFLAIWWGSTIFDSASASPAWGSFQQRAGHPILYATAALLGVCAVVLVAVRRLAGRLDLTASLIPIAVGYTLAHYLSLLLVAGPQGVLRLVQQWGLAEGAEWGFTPAPGLVPILQITLILLGHVLGVLIAHDMAMTSAGPPRPVLAAVADELPVVLFMIACTWTGLFLLFVR